MENGSWYKQVTKVQGTRLGITEIIERIADAD